MRISYKAVYFLIEKFYLRKSLKSVLEEVGSDIVGSSIIFAKQEEDYEYLTVIQSNKERLNDEYVLFMIPHGPPLILFKDKDLTLLEFAILSTHTSIHISEFISLVESTASNLKIDVKSECSKFQILAAMHKQKIEEEKPGK